MPPDSSCSNKRSHPATAAAHRQRVSKRPRRHEPTATSSVEAGATPQAVLDVKPISAIPPPPPGEPPCLRRHFLRDLGLRADLAVHFIDEKRVTSTDLVPQQNRFRIPSDGVERRLRAILTPAELEQANLLGAPSRRPRTTKKKPQDAEGGQQPPGKEPKKKQGKAHLGLSMPLVDLAAGAKELRMSRWDSSQGTVVKGRGYLDFVRRCSFREDDVVQVWAFVERRRVRLFGADVCSDGPLHLLIVKKHQQQPCCSPDPPAPAAGNDSELVVA